MRVLAWIAGAALVGGGVVVGYRVYQGTKAGLSAGETLRKLFVEPIAGPAKLAAVKDAG